MSWHFSLCGQELLVDVEGRWLAVLHVVVDLIGDVDEGVVRRPEVPLLPVAHHPVRRRQEARRPVRDGHLLRDVRVRPHGVEEVLGDRRHEGVVLLGALLDLQGVAEEVVGRIGGPAAGGGAGALRLDHPEGRLVLLEVGLALALVLVAEDGRGGLLHWLLVAQACGGCAYHYLLLRVSGVINGKKVVVIEREKERKFFFQTSGLAPFLIS